MAEPPEIHQAPKAVRDDGKVPFLRPQEGVAPTSGAHLTTRQFVEDTVDAAISAIPPTGSGGLEDNAVTNAKLRDSAALSVIGRSANSTGDPADIAAASDAQVLRRSGTSLGFGQVATAGIAGKAITDALLRDSAALSVIGRSANTTGTPGDLAAGTDGHVLRRSGTTLGFGTIANAAIPDNTIAHARLVNVSGPGLLGSLTGGAVSTIAGTTPPREEPSLADNLIYFQSSVDGAIKRCTVEDLLNVIAAHFGL